MSFFRRTRPDDLDRIRADIIRMNKAMNRQQRERADSSDPTAAINDLAARLDAVTELVTALDVRITAVATELANQLGELGQDIDALQRRPDSSAVPDGALEGLRDSQTRLANEQARYQIAFREDLARLAEQVRRPR